MTRRTFVRTAATGLAIAAVAPLPRRTSAPRAMDILDCHTHFYDPTRPQGVPWPERSDRVLYRPVYPRDYRAVALPYGITGTIVVEASPWFDDNAWVLGLAAGDPLITGLVGHVEAGRPDFAGRIAQLRANPLFRGIRISGRDVATLMAPGIRRDLEVLADRGLTLDVNGDVSSLGVVAAAARAIPRLRIVVDHVANVAIDGQAPPGAWLEGMDAAAAQVNVFCKVSGLVEGTGRRGGKAPDDTAFYRPVLDAVWQRFGDRRVVFGSNWPVSEVFAPFGTVFGIVQRYARTLGEEAERRYFAGNARAAYAVRGGGDLP